MVYDRLLKLRGTSLERGHLRQHLGIPAQDFCRIIISIPAFRRYGVGLKELAGHLDFPDLLVPVGAYTEKRPVRMREIG